MPYGDIRGGPVRISWISERVGALGGRLSFANRPGAGFAVTALLPSSRAGVSLPSHLHAAEP